MVSQISESPETYKEKYEFLEKVLEFVEKFKRKNLEWAWTERGLPSITARSKSLSVCLLFDDSSDFDEIKIVSGKDAWIIGQGEYYNMQQMDSPEVEATNDIKKAMYSHISRSLHALLTDEIGLVKNLTNSRPEFEPSDLDSLDLRNATAPRGFMPSSKGFEQEVLRHDWWSDDNDVYRAKVGEILLTSQKTQSTKGGYLEPITRFVLKAQFGKCIEEISGPPCCKLFNLLKQLDEGGKIQDNCPDEAIKILEFISGYNFL